MDPYASHPASTVLSWIACSPFLIWLVITAISAVIEKGEKISRIVTLWLILCVLALSPARYICFQATMISAFPWQSWSALFSVIPLAMYMPFVLPVAWLTGIGPFFAVIGSVMTEPITRWKTLLVCVLSPAACILGSYLFSVVLPYAAISIHWLKTEDILRATNGPAFYLYEYVAAPWNPMALFFEEDQRGQDVRNHVYTFYLGSKQRKTFDAPL